MVELSFTDVFYLSNLNFRDAPMPTGKNVISIKQVLVFGEPCPIFSGGKNPTVYSGTYRIFPSPNSNMHKGSSGKLLQIYVAWGLV